MDELKQIAPDPGADTGIPPEQAQIEKVLRSYGDQSFHELSRFRFAEEREWYEQGLFYQRRQWLRWNDSTRRFDQVKQNPNKPKPMPVTNYFERTVDSNANQLQKPKIVTLATDLSDANRRAADFAENCLSEIDKESGFDILRPLLAKHDVLWGIGCTKDTVDTSAGAGVAKVAELQMKKLGMVSCLDCGQSNPTKEPEPPPEKSEGALQDTNAPTQSLGESSELNAPDQNATPSNCPNCGSSNVKPYEKLEAEPTGVKQFPQGRLHTEIVPIFEIYLPRDCRNPNLARRKVHRYRVSLGKLRERYGDRAEKCQAEAPYDVHQIYMEALRALVNYNYGNEQSQGMTTVTEMWWEWSEMPRKMQTALENYWADDTATLEKAIRQGLYQIYAGGCMLDWGVNPWWDETERCSYDPFTFYLWKLDPANVYPPGLGVPLTPMQKRLNRLDSLIELSFACNAAGKWLWPNTQTGKPPSGSPNEVVAYEPIGEGKNKPEFVSPNPIAEAAWTLRMQILGDFQQIGNMLGPGQGSGSQSQKSFRGLAYLGAKAEEETNTQRFLWELGHVLRYRKCLLMAQMCWDSPRKVKVAGYNGKFSMREMEGSMLKGMYSVEAVADSSRPILPSEKQQAFATALQAGIIDITDSAVREYTLDVLNLDQVNLTDHLQYEKAERDLEKVKMGMPPQDSPFQKWDIFLKVFANFTLTEEFESLPPQMQQLVLMQTQHYNQMVTMSMAPPPAAMAAAAGQALGHAMKGGKPGKGPNAKPSHVGQALNKVPGQDISPGSVQNAAAGQAAGVAQQLA